MSTHIKEIQLHSADETEALAEKIGTNLRGGECLELQSDIGGGKTTFVRGLARGAGSIEPVSSPTFTVGKQYKASEITIYHYDFYRLGEHAGLVSEELAEAVADSHAVVVVEWAKSVENVLPAERVRVTFEKLPENPDWRHIIVEYPSQLEYLVKGLDK